MCKYIYGYINIYLILFCVYFVLIYNLTNMWLYVSTPQVRCLFIVVHGTASFYICFFRPPLPHKTDLLTYMNVLSP